jgi:multiple sugar transport system ATP-binding protein
MTMADTIVVLNAGNIEQVGAPLELYNKPKNKFVAGFIGSPRMNFIESRVVGSGTGLGIDIGGKFVPMHGRFGDAKPGDVITLGARPEHLTVKGPGVTLGEANVDLVEHLGGQTILYLTLQGGQPVAVVLDDQQEIKANDRVQIHIDPQRCHLFGADGMVL